MSKPNFTQAALAVTDGAETNIVVQTYCQAVYVTERPTATGWPRIFLFRGSLTGSSQQPVTQGTQYRIPGPFQPGDIVGTIELNPNGGDSSTFNVAELSS